MKTEILKPRRLNPFRALLRIFRLEKALAESRRREEGAWFNRNHYCKHINIIGTEILAPRLNGAFFGGNCSPEAVSRETGKLVEKLEQRAETAEADARKIRELCQKQGVEDGNRIEAAERRLGVLTNALSACEAALSSYGGWDSTLKCAREALAAKEGER